MAKWGKGDPRWLVEDRPDATNVNNWHWSEKNASNWSKNKLNELLVGLKFDGEIGTCEIIEISKCEGEATVNNRKGKLIFFYEWTMELKWKGKTDNGNFPATGTFEILNLSEEHEIKDVDVVVTVDDGENKEAFKQMMRSKGIETVKQQLSIYLKCLKEEFSKGLILPTKDKKMCVDSEPCIRQKRVLSSVKSDTNEKNAITAVSEWESVEYFKCTAEDIYNVLTTKRTVEAFTQGDCTMSSVEGSKFELYGGNVLGYFVKLVPNKMIKQKWRFKSWPEEHFSDVTIEITEKLDNTELRFHQAGIPASELEKTREGWKRHYWDSIRRIFGFGSILY